MGFKKDISPILRSMQYVGLMPTGRIKIGGYCVDEYSKNTRPKIPLKHMIHPFIMFIVAWFTAIRSLTVFFYMPKKLVGDIAYDVMFVAIYWASAIMRSGYVYGHLNGNKWLKFLDFLADGDLEDDDASKHPLAIIAETSSQPTPARKHLSKEFRMMHMACWGLPVANIVFCLTIFVMKRSALATLTIPFSYVCTDDNSCYYPGLSLIGIMVAINDTNLMLTNTLVALSTFELAHRFRELHKWVESHRKRYLAAIRNTKKEINFGHKDENVETVFANTNNTDAKEQIGGTFEVEVLLRAHLNLLIAVRKLDKVARWVIAGSMSFGFMAILINMYQIAWGTDDNVIRTIQGYWTLVSMNLLFTHIYGSAFMNNKTVEVQESLFRLPPPTFAIPESTDDRLASVKLSLLLGQFSTEPIALTYIGMFFLRSDGVMELCGGLMAYFLLLVEISAGEKRGNFNNLEAKTNVTRAA